MESMAAKKCRRLGPMGVLPDAMVWEILTWLPIKSLLRFKSVSKLWLSTILDPNFARAHRSPFRGLLAMNPDPSPAMGWSQPTRDFFVANLDYANQPNEEKEVVNFSFQFSIPENIRNFQASNMLNGIICFYNRNVAKLCNIATREIINLPESKFAYKYSTYHLGFDPIESVYKLLKVCPIYEIPGELEEDEDEDYANDFMEGNFNLVSIECEILTLGVDSSWRSISPPPNGIIPHGLCVDGVLYWMTVVPGIWKHAIYAFNLVGEKFQSIPNLDDRSEDLQLVQFGTSPAMACCDEDKIRITHYRDGSWTKMNNYTSKHIPNDIFSEADMKVGGLLPNGNLMICPSDGIETGVSIYLFDENRNNVQECILKFPTSDIILCGRICWYEDNIISLKRLTGF